MSLRAILIDRKAIRQVKSLESLPSFWWEAFVEIVADMNFSRRFLSYIAKPYATFKSLDGQTELVWKVGRSFSFNFKIFGFITLGVHVNIQSEEKVH